MSPTFDAIGLVVADMPTTLAFYRDLGLPIPATMDQAPHAEVELTGGMRLMFDSHETIRSFEPDFVPPTGDGRIGLAFRCADPAEVDRSFAELIKAGHRGHREPWDAPWGQRYATVYDPDGNTVDLYAPLNPA